MANAPHIGVTIGADIADIKSALVAVQGQLKGLGNAGRAAGADASKGFDAINKGAAGLRNTLLGLVGGVVSFRALVGGIGAIARATIESEKASALLEAKLKSLGGSARATGDQIRAMADALSATSTFDDEAITNAATSLLNFTRIDPSNFGRTMKVSLDLAAASGEDLSTTVDKLGKALNDPVKGLKSLRDAGVSLSAGQVELIEKLIETGDRAKAQQVILSELEKRYDGAAEAARRTLGGSLAGLKIDFDNLLEGNGKGIAGTTKAINDLAATMRSQEVKDGFAAIVTGLASIATQAVKTIGVLADLGAKLLEVNPFGFGTATKQQSDKVLNLRSSGLRGELGRVLEGNDAGSKTLRGIDSREKLLAAIRADIAEVDREIYARSLRANSILLGRGKNRQAPTVAPVAEDETPATSKPQKAAADANTLAASFERANEAAKKLGEDQMEDLAKRGQRILEGLSGVQIELWKQTGDEAKAAFAEIDAKYAALIADLRADGNTEGLALVDKLIGIEKIDAQLEIFRNKVAETLAKLREEETSVSAQAQAGFLGATEAEDRIKTIREKSLKQLQDLKAAVEAYYAATQDPAVLAYLQTLDGEIAQVKTSQDKWRQSLEDTATSSINGFFSDLIAGAKSFKEAFVDMVRSFLQGVAQMIAKELALKAVQGIFSLFGGGGGVAGSVAKAFVKHTGGLVSTSGISRSVSPLLFGNAPRYHSGGIAGLGRNEVAAVLERGEEVLTRRDPRHVGNLGRGGGSRAGSSKTVILFDANAVADHMVTPAGEKATLHIIGQNASAIRELLA